MEINIHLKTSDYNIILEEGVLNKVNQYTDLYRKVLIVTDDGIPEEWITPVEAKCKEAYRFTIKAGEESKTLTSFQEILRFMLEKDFTRTDCVVAIGGGVVGDLAGFVAASFMRGIDFYNIPTTLLSQIDSSIGGKTGVNLDHVKNIVGAFYQPKGVLIDPATLRTLDERQIRSGMAEAIKIINGKAEIEVSGNVTKENIARLVDLGVDFISSGALTHSAPILDISLKNLHAV